VFRRLAAAVALTIITLVVMDPLFCADGCAHSTITVCSSARTGAACPLCQAAFVSPSEPPAVAGTTIDSLVDLLVPFTPLDPPTSIERPPRIA
jgi:hypothetical protein